MDWRVCCGMECGTLCDGSGGGVVRDVVIKWWDVECGGAVLCDVAWNVSYVKHGSGMWNWV